MVDHHVLDILCHGLYTSVVAMDAVPCKVSFGAVFKD